MAASVPPPAVPTAPGALPLLGHGLKLLCDPLGFMTSLNELGPLVRMRGPAFTPDVYLVNSPELLHQLLVTDARSYSQARITAGIGSQFGISLVMDMNFDGLTLFASHLRHRRAVQPAFHPRRIAAGTPALRQAVEEAVAGWALGSTLRVDQEMARLAYRVNARAVCGDTPALDRVTAELAALSSQTTPGMYWRLALPGLAHARHVPGTGRFLRALSGLRAAVAASLAHHRAQGATGDDVVSQLLRARYPDTDEPLDDRQIIADTLFLLWAATHGLKDVLPHVFHELALNPDVEQRVHEEIGSVLQGRPVQAEDLPALDYTRRVVKETLRLHPAPWMLGRRALVPVRLGTAELPAGTELAYCTYALHRHPDIHPDPLRFDPDRWLPDRARGLARCSDLAFGAGVRKCIGDALTMNQVLTAVATIAARWRLRPVPGHRYRPRARIVISPGPLPMTCHPRDVLPADDEFGGTSVRDDRWADRDR
ncbi:cytochrome P450 [Streptomyces lomondensis]|uniref:Cytochrome P450 n=1 Tax=Streptomyces lomondensis TaxID=68229 RepID=A0ABQ2X8T2_9ACTN|nr:cytochrome P450 [Streptomyces lomondensis]MCF0077312.1 cytochrome P450 [Streptomyces lomondensis]GGX05024.1 cytochrome P450 [Streptomyces lomondensis]